MTRYANLMILVIKQSVMIQLIKDRYSACLICCTLLIMCQCQLSYSQPIEFHDEYNKLKDTYNEHFGKNKHWIFLHNLNSYKYPLPKVVDFIDHLIEELFKNDTCWYYISHNNDLYEYKSIWNSELLAFSFISDIDTIMRIEFSKLNAYEIDSLYDEDSILFLEHRSKKYLLGSLWDTSSVFISKIIVNQSDTLPDSWYNDILIPIENLSRKTSINPRLFVARNKAFLYLYLFDKGIERYIGHKQGVESEDKSIWQVDPFHTIKIVISLESSCLCRMVVNRYLLNTYQLLDSEYPPF